MFEVAADIELLNIVWPLIIIIFFIASGVFLLNQQFQKNLYRQKLKQEELLNKHKVELLQSNIEVQEAERKRIAKDLHDELGATLSIAKMHLARLEQMHPEIGSEDKISLSGIRMIIDSSITSVRQISHHLMPNQLEAFGLVRALESLVDQINSSKQIEIALNISDTDKRFAWEKELSLYRICMELIQNTLKHSKANHVHIELQDEGDQLMIHYKDDGIGLPENMVHGLGLKSIEARIKSVGGSLELLKGEGFQAELKLPL